MPICEICGQKLPKLYACRSCGIHFCEEDGYPEKNLCSECASSDEESGEELVDDTLEKSEGAEKEGY